MPSGEQTVSIITVRLDNYGDYSWCQHGCSVLQQDIWAQNSATFPQIVILVQIILLGHRTPLKKTAEIAKMEVVRTSSGIVAMTQLSQFFSKSFELSESAPPFSSQYFHLLAKAGHNNWRHKGHHKGASCQISLVHMDRVFNRSSTHMYVFFIPQNYDSTSKRIIYSSRSNGNFCEIGESGSTLCGDISIYHGK